MIRTLSILISLLLFPTLAEASLASLKRFFHDVQSYEARFDQIVLDEAMKPLQESSGTLWIQRPGKFRWSYQAPFEQLIVGDGKAVWVYDPELRQVAVRQMGDALGVTPAQLLAGRGQLEQNFVLTDLGVQGKLHWVRMKPRRNDGGYEDIRIGFEAGKLRVLEMVDGFGKTTRITLRDVKENARIDAARFTFRPPAGVDVIRE